jgi:photosystem II stability/assembly factor-like uncharacterized protein
MKKLVLFLFLVIIQSFNLYAQWFWQNPTPQANTLYSICFTNENTAYSVGAGGALIKTTDTGESWVNIDLPDKYFTNIFFIDENNGFVVGVYGNIFKTTNAGIEWADISISDTILLRSTYFKNIDEGFCIGYYGAIIKTTDGGESWINISSGTSENLQSIYFINDSVGFITGWNGTLLKTLDGGDTWASQLSGTTETLGAISFANNMVGFIIGISGVLLKTTDSGNSWFIHNSDVGMSFPRIDFINELVGYVVGFNGSNGMIGKTIDGGTTWNIQYVFSARQLINIKFINPATGIIVGNFGIILKTTDAGTTWVNKLEGSKANLYDVCTIDSNKVLAVGKSGTIIKTLNAIVPVELISFSSSISENNVTLSWQTATEMNNSGFELQRKQVFSPQSSIGNAEWNTLTFINGIGTTTEPQSYSFVDQNLSGGKYQYRLKQIDFDGTFEYSNTIEVEIGTPTKFYLEQNFPNPFNPVTTIKFSIPAVGTRLALSVQLKVYDVLGKEVATLVNEEKTEGSYEVDFNASDLASGIYYYELRSGEFVETKKMILLK